MDPQATLERFLEACDDFHNARVNQDRLDAKREGWESLRDLELWIGNGGFLPDRKKIKNLQD